MARLKTQYRQNSNTDIPPDDLPADIPESQINGTEAALVEAATAAHEPVAEPAPDVEAVAKAEAEAAQADRAKFALLRQIEAMKRAEQVQRQQHLEYQRVALNGQPLSRDEKLEQWRQQGLTAREALFLREHPTMIDHPEVASFAANAALAAGLERDTDRYWQAVTENFDKAMSHLKAQAEAREPTPDFFRAPEVKPKPVRSAAHFVSAPVSREIPSGTGTRSPSKVTLNAQHLEAAKIAGVSPTEYARQLLKLNEMKQSGEYSDQR
jgi:hypothetical protein